MIIIGELADRLIQGMSKQRRYSARITANMERILLDIENGRNIFQTEQDRAIDKQKETIKLMQKNGLIKIIGQGDSYLVGLTFQGIAALLRVKLRGIDALPKGSVCMVVFDVPEKKRIIRRQLCRLLEEVGFIRIQRSVWVSQLDAAELLKEFFLAKNIIRWIRIYTSVEYK